jgi:hypothetical protein
MVRRVLFELEAALVVVCQVVLCRLEVVLARVVLAALFLWLVGVRRQVHQVVYLFKVARRR